jgi:DNA (cytosine-5)-methyltransferase 1
MNHGSLFSGIGGFDLAAEWMGWNNTFHCEWMPFPRKVLSHYFPNSISYEDITKTDFYIHRGAIDILTGGFPCQPYSSAGKRLGKEDERHLWPHMLRVISEIKPTYVVGENVRGLTNWNGGVVFEEVCTDLENQGYTVQPILLPACSVGAPHRRDRVWFVAYSNGAMFRTEKYGSIRCENGESESKGAQGIYNAVGSNGNSGTATNSDSIRQHQCECDNEEQPSERRFNALNDTNENDGQGNVTNTLCERLQRSIQTRKHDVIEWNRQDKKNEQHLHSFKSKLRFENFPTQPPICSGDDGLPTELDGITFPKWRQESIKGYGNAIVPQVAYEIFKVIAEMDRLEKLQLKLF